VRGLSGGDAAGSQRRHLVDLLVVDHVGAAQDVPQHVVDLQVTFVEGEDRQTLPIGGNPPLRNEEERKKWEDFVSAIRAGAPSPLTVEVVPSGRDG